jgi:hypothetical protein
MSREQQIRDAADRFLAQVRQDTDARLQALAAELLQIARADESTGVVAVERAAVEVARAVGRGGVHARHELISRIVRAVRRLDSATSLHGILEALAEGAAAEAARVVMLFVDGTHLRPYRHHGYDERDTPRDVVIEAVPLLAPVVAERRSVTIDPPTARAESMRPLFLRVLPGRVALALPLVVAEQVVAVLLAEGAARQPNEPGEPVWTEQVEVLVRHASARLENVTSLRTVEVLTGPA